MLRSYRFSIVHAPRDYLDFFERSNRSRSTYCFSALSYGPRHRRGTDLIQHHGRGLTAKIIALSAYEHGQNAAKRGKHLQACPFDTGTMEWRQWREGFLSVARPNEPEGRIKARRGPAFCKPILFDR